VNRPLAYTAIVGGIIITLALGAMFGPIGLLTGIICFWIAKPVIQDML
jgi:hypothetical protein